MNQPDGTTKLDAAADIESVTPATQVLSGTSVALPSEAVAHSVGTDCIGNASPALTPAKSTGGNLRSKGGGKPGNVNRATHGLRGIGWPKGTDHDRRRVGQFTRALEAAVLDAGGRLDIPTVATIQTAARHERHCRLCGRWLREADGLTIDQRRALSLDIARASESRDRAIRELNIGSKAHADPWAAIDARIVEADPMQGEGKANAPASRTEPQGGN